MLKRLKVFLVVLVLCLAGLSFCACDPGINDFIKVDEGPDNPYIGLDIRQFLDVKKCYEVLLRDLLFMQTDCIADEYLAAAQAYTITTSYGIADIAKDPASFTRAQLEIKAQLYDAIKLINFYSNNISIDFISSSLIFNREEVIRQTQRAVILCNNIISFL